MARTGTAGAPGDPVMACHLRERGNRDGQRVCRLPRPRWLVIPTGLVARLLVSAVLVLLVLLALALPVVPLVLLALALGVLLGVVLQLVELTHCGLCPSRVFDGRLS
jgi:hypothetical protein